MLSINMDDVIKVLNSIKSQLIGFGVVAVLLIAVMIACRKQSKSKKYLIRWQAGLGMVLALAITVNLILTGPMYSMVTLATGGGKVSEENVASATQLCEDIAERCGVIEMVVNEIERGQIAEKKKPAEKKKCEKGIDIR